MRIEKRTLNWNPRPSAWKEMQMRQAKAKAFREQNESIRNTTSSLLSSASADQIYGAGDLAAKAAVKRIQAETVAKLDQSRREADDKATMALIYNNKPAPLTVQAGDATIDLQNNTMTLADGKTVNIQTGRETGNIITLSNGSQIDTNTGRAVVDIVT